MFKYLIYIVFIIMCHTHMGYAKEPSELYTHSLHNGLNVIVLEKKTVPVAAVQLWYKVGSYHEKNGIRGMAHLFEHMMFRGSKNIGDEEHSQLIEDLGGDSNAYTADDMTVYIQKLPSKEVELAIKLEAERMERLIIDQKRLSKEKEVVKEEYRWRYENNPNGDLVKQTREILFPKSHYGIGPIGTLDNINGFTKEKCDLFYKTYYSPNNAALIVVGDVNHRDIFRLAETYFNHIPAQNIVKQSPFKPKKHVRKRYKRKSQLPIWTTLFAFYIPETRHPDMYPLTILFRTLSSGQTSRLHRRLVRKKAMADYVYGFDFSLNETGVYAFPAVHKAGVAREIEKEIMDEISQIQKHGITDRELKKNQNQLISGKIFSHYSVTQLARQIGSSLIYKGDPRFFDEDIKRFESVTNEDIIRVANTYFTKKNSIVIEFEPKDENHKK